MLSRSFSFSEQLASKMHSSFFLKKATHDCKKLSDALFASRQTFSFLFSSSCASASIRGSRPQWVSSSPTSLSSSATATTISPLSVLQFSHVQSYKPAGPRRRADDTAKRAQLVLQNCKLDSYVQLHTLFIYYSLFIYL